MLGYSRSEPFTTPAGLVDGCQRRDGATARGKIPPTKKPQPLGYSGLPAPAPKLLFASLHLALVPALAASGVIAPKPSAGAPGWERPGMDRKTAPLYGCYGVFTRKVHSTSASQLIAGRGWGVGWRGEGVGTAPCGPLSGPLWTRPGSWR